MPANSVAKFISDDEGRRVMSTGECCECGAQQEIACQHCDAEEGWISVEEFQSTPGECWCWIVYKGQVVEAYHDYKKHFRFYRSSYTCYMTECISAVMPWPLPSPPEVMKDKV